MAATQDTEITLGTGKMLAFFFGLVALCAVFFGMGFTLGKNSNKPGAGDLSPAPMASSNVRPSAVKSTSNSTPSDLTFYKTVEQKDGAARLAAKDSPVNTAGASTSPDSKAAADPVVPPPLNGYYVQVAAVSKQEDAEALVGALKKKQYAALVNNAPPDKLFHVRVGPYADIKDAEATRAKLVSDGYNPILKK
jgi:DedD protein